MAFRSADKNFESYGKAGAILMLLQLASIFLLSSNLNENSNERKYQSNSSYPSAKQLLESEGLQKCCSG